jgi:hypothetical protein
MCHISLNTNGRFMVAKSVIRKNIIETLKLISSFKEQEEYQETVTIAQVSAEIFCNWFDDFYHPYDKSFQDSFSKQELSLLEEFNVYFKSNGKYLPETHDIKTWFENNAWIGISKKAKEILKSIIGDRNDDT